VQQDRHRPQRYKRQQQQAYYCTVSPYLIGGKALVAKNRFLLYLGSSPKILRWEGPSPNLSPKKIAMWGFVAKHRQGSKTKNTLLGRCFASGLAGVTSVHYRLCAYARSMRPPWGRVSVHRHICANSFTVANSIMSERSVTL
jgi:hypothetical protein